MKRRMAAWALLLTLLVVMGTGTAPQPQGVWAAGAAMAEEGAYTGEGLRIGRTRVGDVNMRREADAKAALVVRIEKKGSEVIVVGEANASDGIVWYEAHYDGYDGYIRSDLIEVLDEAASGDILSEARVVWMRNYVSRHAGGGAFTAQSGGGTAVAGTGASGQATAQISFMTLSPATPTATPAPTQTSPSGQATSPVTFVTLSPATPTATPAPAQPSIGSTVWIPTNGGQKYHTHSGCSGMKGPRQVSIDEAKRLGFDACKKCY